MSDQEKGFGGKELRLREASPRNPREGRLLVGRDMQEADLLCHRIAIIDNGRIRAIDTPEGLKRLLPRWDGSPSLEDIFTELTGRSLEEGEE